MNDPPTRHSAKDSILGSWIGGYFVDRVLGEGGMGKVYRATGRDGSRVALKLVKKRYAQHETFRRRFYREARIAQTIKHPNVVPVFALGEHLGLPYMVQGYIDGPSLAEKLRRDGPLDVVRSVLICRDVARGLDALQRAGMIHRDIKPGNILLDRRGRAYISDFGLAKEPHGSVLTIPGQAIGSVDYMPPEQIRGEPVSPASDIYALGCVIYECLCGRPPFSGVDGMRLLWAHLHDAPPNPERVRGDLPAGFGPTLLLALEKDWHRRPSTAGEYAQMLANSARLERDETRS